MLAKGQEYSLFLPVSLEKKSDFSGHWAEYSLTFSLSSEKYSRLRANAAPDTPYESENGPGELKLFK